MKFRIYRDGAGQWRWQLRARNNRIIADGAEGYRTKAAVRAAVTRLNRAISLVPVMLQVEER